MKRTRLSPVSRHRAKRDAVYAERRRQVFERAEGLCEARFVFDCGGRCDQVHHIAGRAGADPHRMSNLLGCCASCHTAIHTFVEAATQAGFMASRIGGAP